MRLVVRGDVHLDLVSDGLPRLEEQVRVLKATVEVVREVGADVFVDLGDLFNSPRPSPAAYGAAIEYLRDLDEIEGLRSFVLAGNHDKPTRGATNALTPLRGLYESVEVVERPLVVEIDPVLLLLPFVTEAEARKSGYASAYDELTEVALEALEALEVEPDRVVAFSHLEVAGAVLADDERLQRDVGTGIPEVVLESDRVERVFAGHVHKFQTVGKVVVVGSALHVDFGEAADPKGLIVTEI